MKPSTLETTIWLLIYGGLLLLVVGLALAPAGDDLSASCIAAGSGLALLGVILIWVRSRSGR